MESPLLLSRAFCKISFVHLVKQPSHNLDPLGFCFTLPFLDLQVSPLDAILLCTSWLQPVYHICEVVLNKAARWICSLTYNENNTPGCCAIQYIRPKLIFNPNLVKSRLSVTYSSLIKSFRNFAQRTAVILPCSVQNFKTIAQLKRMLWTNEILVMESGVTLTLGTGTTMVEAANIGY